MATNESAALSASRARYDYREHIVDGILPAREVHLFGGPSGAGKTTLLMKLLEDIANGREIFGHASHATPFVYISGDRGEADNHRTMDRLKIDYDGFPLYVAELTKASTLYTIIDSALRKYPDARLVVVEGFATFVPGDDRGIIAYKNVACWLRDLQVFCEKRNITIWGVVHSAKSKKDDKYTSPRERVLGSVSFGAYGNTVFYVEPEAADNTAENPTRLLSILPRNGKDEFYKLQWEDGMLVPVKEDEVVEGVRKRKTNWQVFREWFDTLDAGEAFTVEEGRSRTGLADSSFRFELKKVVDGGEASPYAGRPLGTYLKQQAGGGRKYKNARDDEEQVPEKKRLVN